MSAPPLDPQALADAGVRLDLDAAVATVTLCRPERRNAQTPATWAALVQIGRSLPGDVRVVVLRAEGVSFSAGLDRAMFTAEGIPGWPSLMSMSTMSDAEVDATIAGYQDAFTWWRRPDIVSIAAVQGHAVGAGFQLALGCDLRVLADDAQLVMKETSLGLVPDLAGTKPLVDIVGYSRALEICATGRSVGATEALQLGLAEVVVPVAELEATTADLVAAVLAAPRTAVIETKALLLGAAGRTHADQQAAERAAQGRRIRDLAGLGE